MEATKLSTTTAANRDFGVVTTQEIVASEGFRDQERKHCIQKTQALRVGQVFRRSRQNVDGIKLGYFVQRVSQSWFRFRSRDGGCGSRSGRFC